MDFLLASHLLEVETLDLAIDPDAIEVPDLKCIWFMHLWSGLLSSFLALFWLCPLRYFFIFLLLLLFFYAS